MRERSLARCHGTGNGGTRCTELYGVCDGVIFRVLRSVDYLARIESIEQFAFLHSVQSIKYLSQFGEFIIEIRCIHFFHTVRSLRILLHQQQLHLLGVLHAVHQHLFAGVSRNAFIRCFAHRYAIIGSVNDSR